MLENLENIPIKKIFEFSAMFFTFIMSALKLQTLLPKSRSKIIKDLEIFEKAEKNNINANIIKQNIEKDINRLYQKRFKVYNWVFFVIGCITLIMFTSKVVSNISKIGFTKHLIIDFLFLTTPILAFIIAFTKPKEEEEEEVIDEDQNKS